MGGVSQKLSLAGKSQEMLKARIEEGREGGKKGGGGERETENRERDGE